MNPISSSNYQADLVFSSPSTVSTTLSEENKFEKIIDTIPFNFSEKDKNFEAIDKSIELLREKAWAHPKLLLKGVLYDNSYLINRSLLHTKPDELSLEDREEIWSAVMLTKDPELLQRMFDWGLSAELKNGQHLADILLVEQSPSFRKSALKIVCEQLNIDIEKKQKLYQQAIEWGDIVVSQQLWEYFGSEIQNTEKEPLHALLVDIDYNQEPDNFKARIQLIALMSPLDSFLSWSKRLAKHLDQSAKNLLIEATNDYLEWAPYISHYTGPRFNRTSEIYRGHERSDLLEAIRSQASYARRMRSSVERSLPEVQNTSMMKLIKIWGKENAKYKWDGDFCEFRDPKSTRKRHARKSMYNRVKDYNWMVSRSGPRDITLSEYITKCHYSFCRPTIVRTHQQSLQGTTNKSVGIKSCDSSLTYDLLSRNGDSLTTVNASEDGSWWWTHPGEATVQRQYQQLEKLHQKLQKLPVRTAEDRQTFQKVLAEAYWLLCQAMPTARGTSQYSQNYLAAICIDRGFHPPIPSKEYPEPNPLAISMTRQEFVERFPEFFDSLLSPR